MDAKTLQTKIDELINDYNETKKGEAKTRASYLQSYNERVTNEKMQELIKQRNQTYASTSSRLLDYLESSAKELNKKTPLAKYPLRFSNDVNERLLSEMKSNRAFNFISATKNQDAILKEFNAAIKLDERDYASSLLDVIDSQSPNIVDFSQLPTEKQKYYRDIEAIKKDYEEKLKIADVSQELKKLEILKKDLDGFRRFMIDGGEYYLTPRIARQKTQEEINMIGAENEKFTAGFGYAGSYEAIEI